jgi:hypothetical protein
MAPKDRPLVLVVEDDMAARKLYADRSGRSLILPVVWDERPVWNAFEQVLRPEVFAKQSAAALLARPLR